MIPFVWGAKSSQIHWDRVEGGFQGWEEQEMRSSCLMVTEFQLGKMERVLAMDDCNDWQILWMYLMPLNNTLNTG